MDSKIKNLWPKKEELNVDGDFNKTPYIVLDELADSIKDVYDNKISSMVTASFVEAPSGERTQFCYSLYVLPKNDSTWLKLLFVDVQDDGWYPASVIDLSSGQALNIGSAKNEKEFLALLGKTLSGDNVKAVIQDMLKIASK
jgi:hypothetical protein